MDESKVINAVKRVLNSGTNPAIRQVVADNWLKKGLISEDEYWAYSSKTDWMDLLGILIQREIQKRHYV